MKVLALALTPIIHPFLYKRKICFLSSSPNVMDFAVQVSVVVDPFLTDTQLKLFLSQFGFAAKIPKSDDVHLIDLCA